MTTQRRKQEKEENNKTGIPIFDVLFGLLDRLFKGADGKILASRVATLIVIFVMAIIWIKGDQIIQAYKESSYENFTAMVQADRDKRFNVAIQEQLQIVHVSSGADFSAVYVFRPKNLNYFVDLEVYEGKIPVSVDPRNMGGFPVNKTSREYITHLGGEYFDSGDTFVYLPTTAHNKGVSYMYSCPYFNLDNIYSGTIAMYWEKMPDLTNKMLGPICNQASRAIGRSR